MHFSHDCSVGSTTAPGVVLPPAAMQSSVLTKTPGAFLGSFAARRAKTRDGFCPILMYALYTPVFRAVPSCTHVKIDIFRDTLDEG